MATYSRNTAYDYFHYAPEYPHAYCYVFEPVGGFGAWSGPRPIMFWLHQGGWGHPHMDYRGSRYPDIGMFAATTVQDAFLNGGAIVVVVEYPLGSNVEKPGQVYATANRYPHIWLAAARAIQRVKDECAPGGRLDGLGDPDQCFAYSNSAGVGTLLMSQWCPESWGMIPRAPGSQVALGSTLPKSDHYLRAMICQGPPGNPVTDDPSRQNLGIYCPIIVAVAKPWRYRPQLELFGTMVGTIAAGDFLEGTGSTTEKCYVVSVTGSGAATTIVVKLQRGDALDLTAAETFEVEDDPTTTFALSATPTIQCAYGWLELPQATKEAVSPFQYFEHWTAEDKERVAQIGLFALQFGNPSVQYRASDDVRALIPGKFGADDAHDVMFLDNRVSEIGYPPNFYRSRWGADAATASIGSDEQVILTASETSPIVCTTDVEHGIRTGDTIKVGQAVGMTGMEGIFTATRIDATSFSLDGSTGVGTYVDSGVWAFHNANGNYYDGTVLVTEMYEWVRDVIGIGLA